MEKNLGYISQNFEEIVQQIYEDKFIDSIFEPFVNTITRQNFIKACDEKSLFGNFQIDNLV